MEDGAEGIETGIKIENYSSEYNNARALGARLLPHLSEDGILSAKLNKHYRLGPIDVDRLTQALTPSTEGSNYSQVDVSKAASASLQLVLKAAEAVETVGFRREMRSLASTEATPVKAAALFEIQGLIKAGRDFYSEQKAKNPQIVNRATNESLVQSGKYSNLFDQTRRDLYVSAVLDTAQNPFPRTNFQDSSNPFNHYKDAVKNITIETPNLPAMDSLVADVQPETKPAVNHEKPKTEQRIVTPTFIPDMQAVPIET